MHNIHLLLCVLRHSIQNIYTSIVVYIYFIAFRTTPICSLNSVVQNGSISEMALHIE